MVRADSKTTVQRRRAKEIKNGAKETYENVCVTRMFQILTLKSMGGLYSFTYILFPQMEIVVIFRLVPTELKLLNYF